MSSPVLTKGPSTSRFDPALRKSVEALPNLKRSDKDITKFDKDAASSDVNYFQGSNLSLRAINTISSNGQLEEVGVLIKTEFGGTIRYTFAPGNSQPKLVTLYNQRGVAIPTSSAPLVLPDGTKISFDPTMCKLIVTSNAKLEKPGKITVTRGESGGVDVEFDGNWLEPFFSSAS